uniref:Uncharacterized protein n=1 Tax=Rhodopseudomonas palustris (strain DX-1) TaxID=652103 RepID=E6VP05_RHOPX
MAETFTGIKIKELDDAASGPSGEGALHRLVLKLSHRAPGLWADYFNRAWNQHIYMMKRRAAVFGDTLEIICMPDELEKDHVPELNKVMAETNEAYKRYIADRERTRQAEEERAKRQKQELSELKSRLKFD